MAREWPRVGAARVIGARSSVENRGSRFVWQEGDLQLASTPYAIDAEPRKVRAWVPFRPPFQPKPGTPPWRFRLDLREAVSALVRESEDEILRCVYASSVNGLVDAENVLLYNLGSRHLASTAKLGLRFLRTFAEPGAPQIALAHSGPWHYLEYGFTDPTSEEAATRGALLATWHDVPWPRSAVPRVGALWYAIRASNPIVYGRLDDPFATLGVRIDIEEENATLHPIHVLKPLLDAVISAFHLSVGASDALVTMRVAEQAGTEKLEIILAFLTDERFNVLGRREVVGLYRDGIKWNPADERCVFAQIVHRRRPGPRTFKGELFAIS